MRVIDVMKRAYCRMMSITPAVFNSASDLHRVQSLLINIGYLLGVIPFYFDLRKCRVFLIDSRTDLRRWYFGLCLSLLMKFLMQMGLLRDIQLGLIRPSVPRHIIRIIMVSGFSAFSLMDLHTAWKKTEMTLTINSAQRLYAKFCGNRISPTH